MKQRAHYILYTCILTLSLCLNQQKSYGQAGLKGGLQHIISVVDSSRNQQAREKLYLHLDKPYYLNTDTIWFKAYLLESTYFSESAKSGLFYLELSNSNNQVVRRMMMPLRIGLGWGNIALDEVDFPSGQYTLRAYTNWMRNQGDAGVFTKYVQVLSSKSGTQITGTQTKTKKNSDQQVKSVSSTKSSQNIDLQFMPEGGKLIGGIKSRLGFKAISEDGKGLQVSGRILNSKGEEVCQFKSLYRGIGSVTLEPKAAESYTAELDGLHADSKRYALPAVQASGTGIAIDQTLTDSLLITISASPDISSATGNFYLIGHSRGVVCYAKSVNFRRGEVKIKTPKNIFPSGISHFVLLNETWMPLNERIVYINKNDNLNIVLNTKSASYSLRDSINIGISVTDHTGKPVLGSFSLSVTDDSRVAADSTDNIVSYFLLGSDLKGTIENPAFYMSQTENARKALDNLMLTQGWIMYDWSEVIKTKEISYKPEQEFTISGRAVNLFKGIPNTMVLLYSKNPFLMRDTLTDKDGYLAFKNLPMADTANYMVQAKNRKGGSFLVDLQVDEWKPPVFKNQLPFDNWLAVNEEQALKAIPEEKQSVQIRAGENQLEEVNITAKKLVKGSKNLNGPGNASQVLNEEDLKKAGKMTLFQLLPKYIKDFKVGTSSSSGNKLSFLLNNKKIYFIIDGKDLDLFYEYYQPMNNDNSADQETYNQRFLFIKEYLDNYTAEDIVGIEVMSSQYSGPYHQKFLSSQELMTSGGAVIDGFAYLEITTHGGKGFNKNTPGVYLYKPLPFSLPKQFYRPKYINKEISGFIENRSTIHWSPNIFTNAEGKAMVSFYAGDKPATYTIRVEGADINGGLGHSLQKSRISVVP